MVAPTVKALTVKALTVKALTVKALTVSSSMQHPHSCMHDRSGLS